jgi:hypothetical protein
VALPGRRRWIAAAAIVGASLLAPAARAAEPLGLHDCAEAEGVHQCSGLVTTWDGIPLDTTVTLPGDGARNLPLVVEIHGFGNSKYEYLHPDETAYTGNAFSWARDGYAVLTYTARGLWGSCGTPESRALSPAACARGYIHLADDRFEVRDTQELIGRLVDEGIADPGRIGVTGDSYGGGQSFALAALSDRKMLPDGRLVRWRSPAGTPLRIAAAAPVIPWTDLIYAIAPNGRTLTYAVTPPHADSVPLGVAKASFATGIFAAAQNAFGPGQPVGEPFVQGRPMGYIAPPGTAPEADVATWLTRALAGDPYTDAEAERIVALLERYHSAYYIDPGHRPPPLFVASGFTDDLFPVDEAIRYANRAARLYPGLPLSLFFGDFGHQRAANKGRQRTHLLNAIHRWFDHYLRGRGAAPRSGVLAYPQTCPRDAASPGPFRARTFTRLARGEVRFRSRRHASISPAGGDPSTAQAIDPVLGGGDGCASTPSADDPAAVTYRLPARRRALTLLGAPTIIAGLAVTSEPGAAQIAGRLWDVSPGGGPQTLVARGLYRPHGGRNVWQLHPAAWRFAPGHVAKLELLGNDVPYGRQSNGSFRVEVKRLQLRLPVRQRPDCHAVRRVARLLLPKGMRLAPGAAPAPRGKPRCRRR